MEFCALAALSLVLNCLTFGTFYAAVLMIMVKVSCFPWIWVRVCYSRGCAGLQNPNRMCIDQISKYYKPWS
jgi:hypothetical protein